MFLLTLISSAVALDKKEPGYLSFSIESRNTVDIDLNSSYLAVLLFHSKTAHSVDIEVRTRRNSKKVSAFKEAALMVNGDYLSLTNQKNKLMEIDLWVIPSDLCRNTGLLIYTQAEINFNIAIPTPKEPICLFNMGYGTTRTMINVVPTNPPSDITFYRAADFGGASQPQQYKGSCTHETSQSHFVRINPGSGLHTEIPVSFSGAMSLTSNLSCSANYIPYISGTEAINTKSFGGTVQGVNCAIGLSGDRVAIQLALLFFFTLSIGIIVFVSWRMIDLDTEPKEFLIDKPADAELLSRADPLSTETINI